MEADDLFQVASPSVAGSATTDETDQTGYDTEYTLADSPESGGVLQSLFSGLSSGVGHFVQQMPLFGGTPLVNRGGGRGRGRPRAASTRGRATSAIRSANVASPRRGRGGRRSSSGRGMAVGRLTVNEPPPVIVDQHDVVPMLVIPPLIDSDEGPSTKRARLDNIVMDVSLPAQNLSEAGNESCCSICFEVYETTGNHRLVCLKCGHLFGKSCIERWIQTNRTCPTCKSSVTVKDLRPIFGNLGKSSDSAEFVQVKEQLKATLKQKEELEVRLAKVELDLATTKDRLNDAVKALETYTDLNTKKEEKFHLTVKRMKVNCQLALKGAFARVVSAPDNADLVVCGCELGAVNAQKYGIAKIFNGNLRKVPLHSHPVRCVQINPWNVSLTASTSDDNKLIVADISKSANHAFSTFSLPSAGWSCCWLSESQVVVGLKNGRVLRYTVGVDMPEDLTEGEGDKPIMMLNYDPNHMVLFICSNNCIRAFRKGILTAMIQNVKVSSFFYEPISNCFLLTAPPTPGKGTVLKLYKGEPKHLGEYQSSSTKMSKNTMNIIWPSPTGQLLSAFFDEERHFTIILNWGKPDERQLSDKPIVTITIKHSQEYIIQYAQSQKEAPPSETAKSGVQYTLFMVTGSHLIGYCLFYE